MTGWVKLWSLHDHIPIFVFSENAVRESNSSDFGNFYTYFCAHLFYIYYIRLYVNYTIIFYCTYNNINKNRYFENGSFMSKIQHSEKILYLFLCLHTHRFYTKIPIFIPIFERKYLFGSIKNLFYFTCQSKLRVNCQNFHISQRHLIFTQIFCDHKSTG